MKLTEPDIYFSDISRTNPNADRISDRDREVILKALLETVGSKGKEKPRIVKQIYDLFIEIVNEEDIDRIEVEVFSDVGFNKRVYLVEVYGDFHPIRDVDMIPIPLDLIPESVIRRLKRRLLLEKFEIEKAIKGIIRPFLIKVFRDPRLMTGVELEGFEIPTYEMMKHTFKYGSVLGQSGIYPHVGDDVEVVCNNSSKTWVTFQGLVPGLTLKEFDDDLIKRKKDGQINQEEYQKQLSMAERAAVKAYFQMWQTLSGLFITDPSRSNIMIDGSYQDGYYSIFFDIDRLTIRPVQLLEIMQILRRQYGLTSRWNVLFDGFLDAFCDNNNNAYKCIDMLYSEVEKESFPMPGISLRVSKHPGLYELVKRYRDYELANYKKTHHLILKEDT